MGQMKTLLNDIAAALYIDVVEQAQFVEDVVRGNKDIRNYLLDAYINGDPDLKRRINIYTSGLNDERIYDENVAFEEADFMNALREAGL